MNDSALPPDVSFAPTWALNVGIAGRSLVVAAAVLFALAFLLSFAPRAQKLSKWALYLGSASLVGVMAALASLFIGDQFEYAYVFNRSEAVNPITYKFASIWTAQEGSFLLWGVTSAVFGSLAVRRGGEFARAATGALGLFLAGISAILYFGSPFDFLKDVAHAGRILVPPKGAGMTPALQNYWVVIHPPTIFTGFGLLVVPFAFALAGVIRRDLAGWIRPIRAFILWGVAILGLGISMGGLWAYETQGWGGFWAWDPVENVSLVPWLFLVGLAHAAIVQARTGGQKVASVALGLLPFLLFVYGTFLTRSGLLDKVSVHSFASMEGSSLQVLRGMLVALLLTVVAASVGAFRIARLEPAAPAPAKSGFDRAQAYAGGILLLSLIGLVVAIGMSWPVITALRGGQGAKVEEGLYNRALLPFFVPILVLMAVTPFVSWRAQGGSMLARRVTNALSISLALTGLALIAAKLPSSPIPLDAAAKLDGPFGLKPNSLAVLGVLVFLCVFVGVANAMKAGESLKRSKLSLGGFVSHFGIAVLMGGLIISRGLERKERIFVREGSPGQALGYTVTFRGMTSQNIFDRNGKVLFDVVEPDGSKFVANPTLYFTEGPDGKPKDTIWPHIERSWSHDVYLALREPVTDVFSNPLNLKPGETKVQDGLKVTYIKPTMVGQPGQPGTKFGAVVRVAYNGQAMIAHPELEITPEGPRPTLVQAGKDFKVALSTISPRDRSISIQAMLSPPIYPIELFEKPLTSLVWLGTGIFTIGGGMSALARRSRRPMTNTETEVEPEPDVPATREPGFGGPGATLPAPQS